MERIYKLIEFYTDKGDGAVEKLVDKLWSVIGASDNEQAIKKGECALAHLTDVSARKDHIDKLKSFLFDLLTGKKKYQPQM